VSWDSSKKQLSVTPPSAAPPRESSAYAGAQNLKDHSESPQLSANGKPRVTIRKARIKSQRTFRFWSLGHLAQYIPHITIYIWDCEGFLSVSSCFRGVVAQYTWLTHRLPDNQCSKPEAHKPLPDISPYESVQGPHQTHVLKGVIQVRSRVAPLSDHFSCSVSRDFAAPTRALFPGKNGGQQNWGQRT
jgi:hypothetical protein